MRQRGELIGLLALAAFFGFLFAYTFGFSKVDLGAGIGAAFWPRLVIGLTLILIAVQVYVIVKGKPAAVDGTAPADPAQSPPARDARPPVRLALLVGYVVAVPWLGFAWATPLFLFVAIHYFSRCCLRRNLAITLAVSASIVVLYTSLLYVPLPKGAWVFEDATNALLRLLIR